MSLKIVKKPIPFEEWAARQSTVRLECRLGRHWIASITDLRHTKHGFNARLGCFELVQACRRGCGTFVKTSVNSNTGELVARSRYNYDTGYQRLGAGRMTKAERGYIRLLVMQRAAEKDQTA